MSEPMIDDLLTRSAPPSRTSERGVQVELNSLVHQSRESARSTRRRTRLWWLAAPVIIVPAIAFATTAGIEPRMVPDFTIPVSYTTDTGHAVSCSIDFFNGEILYIEQSTAAVDYLRSQDWTGIGQRLYDTALTYETTGDKYAWSNAENDLIIATLPDSTLAASHGGLGANSHCTGELH